MKWQGLVTEPSFDQKSGQAEKSYQTKSYFFGKKLKIRKESVREREREFVHGHVTKHEWVCMRACVLQVLSE